MDVAIRDAMLPGLDSRSFFQALRHAGVSAIEVEVAPDYSTPHLRADDGTPFSVADAPSARRLRARLDAEGVGACALLIANDFTSANADGHVEWAVNVTRAAAELGAAAVRVDPLARDKSVNASEARDRFARATERVLRRTADTGVDLGMENHGSYANDPMFLDAVLAAVPDPRLGLTLDTGNFYWFGFPLEGVYELIEKYAPAAKHTHLKSINYPPDVARRKREVGHAYGECCCALHEGNLDLRRVVKVLRDAGYDRDLCVEDESLFKHAPENRVDVLRREVEALRGAMGAS
jgi:sugar phosphate isomerase/epimerase